MHINHDLKFNIKIVQFVQLLVQLFAPGAAATNDRRSSLL